MQIETRNKVSPLTQEILKRLETSPVVYLQFDDSLEQQTARKELLAEDGFSCLTVLFPPRIDVNSGFVINTDFPIEFRL